MSVRLRLGARDGLRQREKQSHVAVDAFPLEHFAGANALPRRGDLDEDAFASDALPLVEFDESVRLGDERLGVEGHVRVRLGRDAARNDLQNLHAKRDEQVVHDLIEQFLAARAGLPGVGDGLFDDGFVFRHLRGLEDERGIRGRVLRRVLLERGEVAAVGDDGRELLELVELVGHFGQQCRKRRLEATALHGLLGMDKKGHGNAFKS